jgi:phospholipase D1/2
MCVSGPIALRLGEYVRDCWSVSAGACPAVVDPPADLWPDGVRVDFRGARMAISRTLPPRAGRPSIREIEALYLKAIETTQLELYFENQYFTSTRIAHAIARQCQNKPQLQGLLVGCMKPKTWIEYHTMGYGRACFNEVLQSSGIAQRVPLVAALNRAGEGINVHSKLAIFDDRLLTVGSANLNQRSMGFDVECNLSLEACTATERQKIRALRNQLLGEHLSLSSEEVPSAIQTHGLANLPHAIQGQRRLVPVSINEYKRTLGPALVPFFDREEQWSTPLPPATPSASVRWQHALMLGIVALAGGALGYSLFGDDQTTLASLQKIIELF